MKVSQRSPSILPSFLRSDDWLILFDCWLLFYLTAGYHYLATGCYIMWLLNDCDLTTVWLLFDSLTTDLGINAGWVLNAFADEFLDRRCTFHREDPSGVHFGVPSIDMRLNIYLQKWVFSKDTNDGMKDGMTFRHQLGCVWPKLNRMLKVVGTAVVVGRQ